MNNCGPMDDRCLGDEIIPCRCMCDNCEGHEMECPGCVNCEEPDGHVWVEGLDPRWLICETHPHEAMLKIAA